MSKSRQEEAWEFISNTFVRLIDGDKELPYETKRSIKAFWEDMFAHEGVKNNITQAVNNFLWEIDDKMDSARRAGIQNVRDIVFETSKGNTEITFEEILGIIDQLLAAEGAPEEEPLSETEIMDMDLSEVGEDEDDIPIR